MSDDPETLRQIEELAADDRPLLVLDVDDVVLEFIRPFPKFLERRGLHLTLTSFRLTGNIAEKASGRLVEQPEVTALLDEFFHSQADWQTVTEGAAEALALFGDRVEIVMLTAMFHRHRAARRAHLDALGLPYPLLSSPPKWPRGRRWHGCAAAAAVRSLSSTTSPTTSSRRASRCRTPISFT